MRHYLFTLICCAAVGTLLLLADPYSDNSRSSAQVHAMPVASIGDVLGRL